MPSIYHLLSRQIPSHIQQKYPIFCKFIEYYYRWLQTTKFVNVDDLISLDSTLTAITIDKSTCDISQYLHQTISNQTALGEVIAVDGDRLIIRYLRVDAKFAVGDTIHIRPNADDSYQSIDDVDHGTITVVETIPSMFIDHFSNMVDADHIFGTDSDNIAIILRTIRQLYQTKGNQAALKYLIKAVKGVDVEVRTPWENVLRFSDGKWNRQYSVTVRSNEQYWHYTPTNVQYVRVMYDQVDDNGNQLYQDIPITKIEIFGKQSENYDQSYQQPQGDDLPPLYYDNDNNPWDESFWTNLDDQALLPFTYDENDRGWDTGYWNNLIDIDALIKFVYDKRNSGWDKSKWDIVDPNQKFPSDDNPLKNSINTYDENGPWWIRDEHPQLGQYQIDPVTGAIIFDGDKIDCTYGRWGYRYVTPFIRLYFDQPVDIKLGQEIRTIELNDDGKQYVSYAGNVVEGISGLEIVDSGAHWQVGQVFTASKDQIWTIYSEPVDSNYRSVSIVNQDGVTVEYSIDKPLIGRVLAVDSNGGIQSVEILQYGDHVPLYGGKDIVISPLFDHNLANDQSEYQATLRLKYGIVNQSTGYFDDPSGFVSYNDIRIHDSDYYQQFSYDIVSNVDGSVYRDLANLLHPAGTKMFTTYQAESDLDASADMSIDCGDRMYSASIFDVAYLTDLLVKTTDKKLTSSAGVTEAIRRLVQRSISQSVSINDTCYNQNIIEYAVDVNYDVRDSDLQAFQRTFEGTTKTGYVDSGTKRSISINYDYHYVDDFPSNPPPQVKKGGYVTLRCGDGVVITNDFIDNGFYSSGDTVTIEFMIDDRQRYQYQSIELFNRTTGEKTTPFVQYDPYQYKYSGMFTIGNDDIDIMISTVTRRYSITIDNSDTRGVVKSNRSVGFAGEQLIITVEMSSDRYNIDHIDVITTKYGTYTIERDSNGQYITQVVDDDMTIVPTYTSNGGMINVVINGGGEVTWSRDITDFITAGTPITFTVVDSVYVQYQSATVTYRDQTSFELDQTHTFDMVNQDVTITINFVPIYRTVKIEPTYIGSEAGGTISLSPTPQLGRIPAGTTITVSARPKLRSQIDRLYYVANGVAHELDQYDVIHVSQYDVTIYCTFVQNGGYIDVDSNQYQLIKYTNIDIDRWVDYQTNVVIEFGDQVGQRLDNATVSEKTSGDIIATSTTNQISFTMPRDDVSFMVTYQPIEYSITTSVNGPGTVTCDSDKALYDQQVAITATSNSQRDRLVSLIIDTGDYTIDITNVQPNDNRQRIIRMPSSDITIIATFEQYIFDIVVPTFDNGSVELITNQPSTIDDHARTYQFEKGTIVNVDVRPNDNYYLDRLYINFADGTSNNITSSRQFHVNQDGELSGEFAKRECRITVNPPQYSGTPSMNDQSLTVYNNSRLNVTTPQTTIVGPLPQGTSVIASSYAGDVITCRLSTDTVADPSNPGFYTTAVLDQVIVVTSQQSIAYTPVDQVVTFEVPDDNIIINCRISKRTVTL